MEHVSVLLEECINGLKIKSDGIYVDGTLGRAGHASKILELIPNGHLYAFDKDEDAIKSSKVTLQKIARNFTLYQRPFSMMQEVLSSAGVSAVDGILLDLGVSSPHFDNQDRGFSYRNDGKLDMRMDQNQKLSAYEVVNTYSFHELKNVFYTFGEEKQAVRIARAIEKYRTVQPIETTFQLVDVIKTALPDKLLKHKGHPAKKVFQAIRIEVNHELEELKMVLKAGIDLLKSDGRMCVISFHSLEDRLVKQAFKEISSLPKVNKRVPLKSDEPNEASYILVTRKAIVASEFELENNRRSHSAKLRIIEKR